MHNALSAYTAVVATGNGGKSEEVLRILARLGIRAVTLESLGFAVLDVEETQTTYTGNARLKANAHFDQHSRDITEKLGKETWFLVCEDFGLAVDALLCLATTEQGYTGFPGLYTRRFHPGTDADRARKVLYLLKQRWAAVRTAKFFCGVALRGPGIDLAELRLCNGQITIEPRGDQSSFPLDQIFIPSLDREARTFGEMRPEAKDRISARGLAVRAVVEELLKKLA